MPSSAASRATASSGSAVVNDGVVEVVRQPSPKEEPEGVGVHRDRLGLELDRLGDQRQLEPVGVGGPEVAEHLAGLEHAVGPAAAAVGGGGDRPEVLAAAQGGGAVLGPNPEDLSAALRVDAEHRRGKPVGADHQVADLQAPDRPEPVGGQDLAVVRLRAAPHIGQRGDFDRAAFHHAADLLGVDHLVEGVVEGAQVGVDLLGEGAGEEAELLAGFDGRAGEDQAVDLLGHEGLDGDGHGQVGLAGAGGADAEDDGVLADGVDVLLLADRLGLDGAAAAGQDRVAEDHRGAGGAVAADDVDGPADGVGGEGVAPLHQGDELLEEAGDPFGVGLFAGDGDLVAADEDGALEGGLDQLEQLVPGSEEADHRVVPGDQHLDLDLCWLPHACRSPLHVGMAPEADRRWSAGSRV